jgi:hypothetical protein
VTSDRLAQVPAGHLVDARQAAILFAAPPLSHGPEVRNRVSKYVQHLQRQRVRGAPPRRRLVLAAEWDGPAQPVRVGRGADGAHYRAVVDDELDGGRREGGVSRRRAIGTARHLRRHRRWCGEYGRVGGERRALAGRDRGGRRLRFDPDRVLPGRRRATGSLALEDSEPADVGASAEVAAPVVPGQRPGAGRRRA